MAMATFEQLMKMIKEHGFSPAQMLRKLMNYVEYFCSLKK
ncbi:linalool synthase [Corchorus olitorius]|uniref:Linalool synthase n=1 Tax=Corchorus olitorius TaxID=93759 RepID=A0A1R3I545_9ROSI|nr:linalool synthase [Corchorus olitorius]